MTRREMAVNLGFAVVVEPDDLAPTIEEVSLGRGADVFYECAGVASLLQPSAELVRRGGTLALLGFPLEPSTVRYGDWQTRELTVVGSLAYGHADYVGAIRAIAARRLDVASLHTGTVGLSGLQHLLEELDSGQSSHTKALVSPQA